MVDTSWERLTAGVAERLPWLEEGDVIILGSGRRYTQLMQRPGGVTVEAAANQVLPPEQQLGAEQEDLLRERGWQPPNPPLRHNWWLDVNRQPLHRADADRIAGLMVSTLRDVYGVADPGDITESAFNAFT